MTTTRPNLTGQQAAVLALFARMTAAHPAGLTPTIREMADAMGVGVITCYGHVQELVRKGRMRRTERYKARNLQLVEDPREGLLYRLARHVRNTDGVQHVGTYARQAGELLAELQRLDPAKYARLVKDAPATRHAHGGTDE